MKRSNFFVKNKFVFIFSIVGIIFGLFLGYFIFGFSDSRDEAYSQFNEIIEYNTNLSYTQQIFEHCSDKENVSEQVFCINQYVVQNWNFNRTEEVYSIDDMFDKGADCKSYSMYYATLAKMLGYDYLIVNLPTHVFTILYFDEGYCLLDEKFYDCIYYNEQLNNSLSRE